MCKPLLKLFVQGQQTDYIMDNVSEELLTKFKAPRELNLEMHPVHNLLFINHLYHNAEDGYMLYIALQTIEYLLLLLLLLLCTVQVPTMHETLSVESLHMENRYHHFYNSNQIDTFTGSSAQMPLL